jgi:tRNA-splicing ligase RtcB
VAEQITPKLLNWASSLEPEARAQACRTAALDVVEGVALMPDAHFGLGATVGSVIATENVVIPAAVGVDIGCGMIACHTNLTASQLPDDLSAFLPRVEQAVPAGVGRGHPEPTPRAVRQWVDRLSHGATFREDSKRVTRAVEQLGTLGSGNHFFEICVDTNGDVWVVLHSGSRGIGNTLAQGHIKTAKRLARQEYHLALEDPDLAYLLADTPEFNAYVHDMLWAQEYARVNRELMMDAALEQLAAYLAGEDSPEVQMWGAEAIEDFRINCHHNFTTREVHDGRALWVTRKGAIKADVDDLGVIPGSMGTRSYIVHGLGNPLSYNSCSHGAGRRMSRNAARRQFDGADLAARMEGKTWQRGQARELVDEIPDAYKDIDVVMRDQQDLVYVVAELTQVLNYKGT